MRRSILSLALVILTSVSAIAETGGGLLLGFRQNSVTAESDGITENSEIGYQFGGVAFIDIAERMKFRTGFIYAQRKFTIETDFTSATSTYTFNYFDIPATIMFDLSDMVSVFGGITLGIKTSDECTATSSGSCDADDVKSMVTPLLLGANFKVAPELGFEVYLEKGSGEIADGVKDLTAVGANVFYMFE